MGNCIKGNEQLNEHSNVQRRIRIGLGLKKGEDGNFHFGLEGGLEIKKDKDFIKISGEINNEISIPDVESKF